MNVHFIPEDGWRKLEFDKLLDQIVQYCISDHTKSRIQNLDISSSSEFINREFQKIKEWSLSNDEKESLQLMAIYEVEEDVNLLRKENYVLSVDAILKINLLIQNHKRIQNHFTAQKKAKYPLLFGIFEQSFLPNEVYFFVDRVFTEEGDVKDSASPELLSISKQLKSKQRAIDQEFNKILGSFRNQGLLTDSSESYRNGRRVLSVPAENKRKIKGIIHDESGTGKTVFIEPEAIISLNNDLFDLFAERKREIFKIIKSLCAELRPYCDNFLDSFELQTEYDVIQSKCAYSSSVNAVIPKINESPIFSFKSAYHPLLLLKNKKAGKITVPFDLILHGQNKMLLISGPNAGGKSILMKAIGLLQLMFQASIPIPVGSDTTMGVFKKICVDIGDQQSIEDDLSTYSSRLKNMKEFCDTLDQESLVLIDEFGSGTDPTIGGAIAEALLRDFVHKKSFGVITSHYSNLKLYAFKAQGIVNGAMIFDQKELQATYEMKVGRPGSSFAFEIAAKTGLDEGILKYAKSKTGEENVHVEDLLTDLQREKKDLELKVEMLENKGKDLEKLIKNYESLHGELEYKRKKLNLEKKTQLLVEKNQENKVLEKLIKEIKENQNLAKAKAVSKAIKNEQSKLSEQISTLKKDVFYNKSIDISMFKKGDFVKMKTGSDIGQIIRIKKDMAELVVGIMRMFVPLIELLPAREPIETQSRKSVIANLSSNLQDVDPILDIRGLMKGEAIKVVEDFLDKVLLSNIYEVKIIHGVGNGVLKKVVWNKAKEYKDFTKIWHPEENAGGEGVTLIQL